LIGTLLVWALTLHLAVPLDVFQDKHVLMRVGDDADITRTIKLVILLVSVGCLATRVGIVGQVLSRVNKGYLAFLALVPLSVLWSISPADTISRFMGLVTITAVALALSTFAWHERQFQNDLRAVLTFLLCGSLVFGALAPQLAVEIDPLVHGAWHGLAVTKNWFGQMAGLGLIFWIHGWLAREVPLWRSALFAGAALACMILSKSSTAFLATVFALTFMLMLMRTPRGLRRYMPYIVGVFAALVITYAVAVLRLVPGLDILLDPITLVTGKDMTFTDRSVIWDIIKQHIALSPIIGSGYGAYWTGPNPWSPSYIFIKKMYFYPAESHNGYLEMVNDLGFVGLGVLLVYMYCFIGQSLRIMRIDRTQGALFLSIFFEQAINNLSEATWLDMNGTFIFATVTIATFAMARVLLEADACKSVPRAAPAAAQTAPLRFAGRRPGMRP